MGRGKGGEGKTSPAGITAGWAAVMGQRRYATTPAPPAKSAAGGGRAPSHAAVSDAAKLAELLAFDGPAIVLTDATSWLTDSEQGRTAKGPVAVYDPFQMTGRTSAIYSPLHDVNDWDSAQRAAGRLAACEAAKFDSASHELLTKSLLPALMLYASQRTTSEPMAELVRLAYHVKLPGDLKNYKGPGKASLDAAVARFVSASERAQNSSLASAQALLRGWRFTRVNSSTLGDTTLADDLFTGGAGTLYIISDAKARRFVMPAIASITAEMAERAKAAGRQMLLCADEPYLKVQGIRAPAKGPVKMLSLG